MKSLLSRWSLVARRYFARLKAGISAPFSKGAAFLKAVRLSDFAFWRWPGMWRSRPQILLAAFLLGAVFPLAIALLVWVL